MNILHPWADAFEVFSPPISIKCQQSVGEASPNREFSPLYNVHHIVIK